MNTSRGLTVREIAEQQGLSPHTVLLHRGREPELWQSWEVGERKEPGRRGRPEKEYDADLVADYYESKQQASPQGRRGPKRKPGNYDPEEIVGWQTIAERLGVNADTLRGYPSRTRGDNPFPAQVAPARYRWGDIERWDDQRRGSGRRGVRTPTGVPAKAARAHIARLERAGLSLQQIAQASQVPTRTVRRVASGELPLINPDHESALLAIAVSQT